MRMIRTGVHLQLAVHRLADLRLREHAAHGVLHEALRMALTDDARARLPKSAFVSAVLAINFLVFFAAGEFDLRGVDDDDVIAGVDEGGIRRFVLALKNARRASGDAAEYLAVGVNQMPARAGRGVIGAGDERRHSQKPFPRKKPLCWGGPDPVRASPTTTNPDDTNVSGDCQAEKGSIR